jgi:Carboxypeptidase C (cathepsin A)
MKKIIYLTVSLYLIIQASCSFDASQIFPNLKIPKAGSLNPINPNFNYPEATLVNTALLGIPYPGQFYTGYITVNKTSGSKIFYQLYAARGNKFSNATVNDTAPLVMPLAGGPGSPGYNSFFESGPFKVIMKGGKPTGVLNEVTFNDNYHLLYLDNPVGVGFSVYNNDAPGTSMINGIYLENFLLRFFELFPSLKKQQFYIMGESYGAHFALGLASTLLKNKATDGINITGIIFQSGWFDPYNQITGFDKLAISAGLADNKTCQQMITYQKRFQQDILTGNYSDAVSLVNPLMNLFPKDESWNNYRNNSDDNLDITTILWLMQPAVHVGLGVDPEATYNYGMNLRSQFVNDFPVSYASNISYMLNSENIKFLLFVGQDDATVPLYGTEAAISNLNWSKLPLYLASAKKIWKDPDGNVIGWYKHYDKFTYATIYGSGHICGLDQPWSVKNIVDKFIQNTL